MSDLSDGKFKNDNMSGWIGGVVTAGAGLVNGIISAFQNRKLRKLQVQEAQKNRDWQEEMYNKYQSPQAQADQMAAAGMNPYAHTESPSSVGSGSTASISQGQPVDVYSPVAGAVTQIQDARLKAEQIKQMQQQTESIFLDNVRKAFDNGNAAEVYKKQMEILESELRSKILTEQEFQTRVDMLQLEYDQRKDAADQGINSFVDDHNESVARVDQLFASVDKIRADIINDSSRLDLESVRTYSDQVVDLAQASHINSQTDANEFYRKYIQPLEAYIKQSERFTALSEKERSEIARDSERLDFLLRTGNARGFVSYLNYYLPTLVDVAPSVVFAGKLKGAKSSK